MGPIHKITSYTLMAVCLLLGGAGIDGGVLCIKASGQIDLELGLREVCLASTPCRTAGEGPAAMGLQPAEDETCGLCLDVPVGGDRANVRWSSDRSSGAMRLAAVPPSISSSSCVTAPVDVPDLSLFGHSQPSAAIVATVVLLI